MKKLKTKTFYTIFTILSVFLVTFLFISNYQNYNKEYLGIKNNLTRMNNLVFPIGKKDEMFIPEDNREGLNNRIIMDYEIYTVLLNNQNKIMDIINHSENKDYSNIKTTAEKILEKSDNDTFKVGNLYLNKYSYSLKNKNTLIIINTEIIRERLLSLLMTSIIIFIIFEVLILYISKLITNWITKPALDSFNKQKEFIIDASHELKTPLAVIMASADALENERNSKKWLNNIKSETERMNDLISRLLELSKLENAVNKEAYSNINLSKLIEKSTLTFEGLAYENKLGITTNIEKDISFNCNSIEINELISILLDNAIKHSTKNEKIVVNLFKKKDEIILEVINKGDEIPKEEETKIFERFYRIDKSRNRKANRYGLGLAIAKNIVENHNGKIVASSNNGITTFKVTLKNKEH